jgi:hypothetical protein
MQRGLTSLPALTQLQGLGGRPNSSINASTGAHSSSSSSRMERGSNGDSPAAAAGSYTAHVEMKSLVLLLPPEAAAIAQRLVSRWVVLGADSAQQARKQARAQCVFLPECSSLFVVCDFPSSCVPPPPPPAPLSRACAPSPPLHAGTRSTSYSAGCGQRGQTCQCRQRQRPGGGTRAPQCWQSAGSGERQAACGRRCCGAGSTFLCTAQHTAARLATCAQRASAGQRCQVRVVVSQGGG